MAERTERNVSLGGLTKVELELLRTVFRHHPELTHVKLHGSRARGTERNNSDIDLALFGDLSGLECRRIRSELDELPLPYRFDVTAYSRHTDPLIKSRIDEEGVTLYARAGE
ncbi:MAG: nucleotidyltransferase domain-containing protein [Candidatus Hydrogenedentota bacterium]